MAVLTSRWSDISDIIDRASLNGTAMSSGASASGHVPLKQTNEVRSLDATRFNVRFIAEQPQPSQMPDGEVEIVVGRQAPLILTEIGGKLRML